MRKTAITILLLLTSIAGTLAVGGSMGVMTHFAHGWELKLIDLLQADGFTEVRDELYWSEIEKSRGIYAFPPRYTNYMAALAAAGVTPLIALTFSNSLYDEGRTPHTQPGLDAYARYASAVLDQFGHQVRAVEIWNEFNGAYCDGPAAEDRARSYIRLLATAAAAIRSRHPRVTIVGGVTAGVPYPYLEKLFAGGALANMDAVSVHPYRCDRSPEGIEEEIQRLDDLIKKYANGKPKPVWVTGIGWGSIDRGIPGEQRISPSDQCDFLVRSFALLRSAGVENIYWYLFRDYDSFPTMGLRGQRPDYSPKPLLVAFRTVKRWLEEAEFLTREASRSDVYSLRFRDRVGEFRVLWALSPAPLQLGEGAIGEDLAGHNISQRRVVLTGSPICVRGALPELPAAEPKRRRLADSNRDFALTQHANGWSYGFQSAGAPFQEATEPRITDWTSEWRAMKAPWLCLTAEGQHPSSRGTGSIEAVRRWRSDYEGRAWIRGRVRCGIQGDGVTVCIRVDAREVYATRLGKNNSIEGRFVVPVDLTRGCLVALAIGPGETGNADFDDTRVELIIEAAEPP